MSRDIHHLNNSNVCTTINCASNIEMGITAGLSFHLLNILFP